MNSTPHRRWYQFSVLNFLALVTIVAIVPISGHAWRQRQQAKHAIAAGKVDRTQRDQAMQIAQTFDLENRMLCNLVGYEPMTQAEYATIKHLVKDQAKMRIVLERYEKLLESIEPLTGEQLLQESRNYPSIVHLFAQHIQGRDKSLVEAHEIEQALNDDRDRFKQEADEYKTRCERLEKTLEERGNP